MLRKLIVAVGLVFIVAAIAYAEPPKIIKGYGLTEWGQSVEQVKKLVPNLKEVTPSPWNSVKKDLISEYVVPAQEPFKEIRYWFADGRLYRVSLVLSDGVLEQVGVSSVSKIVARKYWEDKEVKDLMTKEGIFTSVSSPGTSTNSEWTVTYEKKDILTSAEEKAKKEQELKRQEAIKKLRLEDLL